MVKRQRLLLIPLCLFVCIEGSLSFSLVTTTTTRTPPSATTSSPRLSRPRRHNVSFRSPATTTQKSRIPLRLSTTVSDDRSSDDEYRILGASAVVGAATAAVGFLYARALNLSRGFIWSSLPAAFSKRGGLALNPVCLITGICTLGGLVMGLLTSKLRSTFKVYDFVSALSSDSDEARVLPRSRTNVLPLLVMSCMTSAFGFSVGPEAPMVCAGGLVGASIARKMFGGKETKKAETMAYAGAAGAITAFMGIPIAGSIFALEMTRSNAGMASGAEDALSPAVFASVVAILTLRGLVVPGGAVGGHFDYGSVGFLSGGAMVAAAVASGVGGAVIGTVFHKLVGLLKGVIWRGSGKGPKEAGWKKQVLVKTTIGLLVGLISSFYPQTLFWGEGSLQCAIDGQKTAFAATHHGLSELFTGAARVDPNLPFASAGAAAQVGIAKIVSISLACAGAFPGGIIFPLFFAAAPFAHAFWSLMGGPSAAGVLPVVVMCLMASTQGSVTRTPLASALILSLGASSTTELSIILPACLVSSYVGVYVARLLSRNSYFRYGDNK